MRFSCLKVEGGLLASDLIDRIYDGNAPGQASSDFGLKSRLESEIAAVWQEALDHWEAFLHRLERLPEKDTATTVTRDQWIIPLLSLLGYELIYTPRAAEVEGKTFPISHRADAGDSAPPVHIVGCRLFLDRRPESGKGRFAPHSLVQEYLNRSENLWGVVTNGFTLRLLRQNLRRTQPAYLEFDLQEMMSGKNFADFSLFYRLVHRSRLPLETPHRCWLERYYQETIEQGSRVRDRLRDGVEKSLQILGQAFLRHHANDLLREKVRSARLAPLQYYQQLLRLIYRLLFLMVTEERGILTADANYRAYYSVNRLRRLCENRRAYSSHEDLWEGIKITFKLLANNGLGEKMGLSPLNGPLFEEEATADLNDLSLTNDDFLTAIWYLSMYRDNERTPWRRVNYAALDVEELGSVYESLLDYQPLITWTENKTPEFTLDPGTERKSTGSYYTPHSLVEELISSTLLPVLKKKLASAGNSIEAKKKALLSIKVCDPACGSGHFLLAAARLLGQELARLQTGADEPSPDKVRAALREVISACLYGVDKNPMAVELCKLALWIEGHNPGKPLTFLDHRIRCGDSLVGVLDEKILLNGIPDQAYKPIEDDDKAVARRQIDLNYMEREGQQNIIMPWEKFAPNALLQDVLLGEALSVLAQPDDTPEIIRQKVILYQKAQQEGSPLWESLSACHIWTAAFFTPLTGETNRQGLIPLTGNLMNFLAGFRDEKLLEHAHRMAQKYRFFHWPLEYPEVFDQGGFDVVLCNPPWERIKLQEIEFFSTRDQSIAKALNRAARQRLIKELPQRNPSLWKEFQQARRDAAAQNKFLRGSGRFPLTARGDINTYSVFAELFTQLLNPEGRAGVVIPTGIATDDTNKHFFASLVGKGFLSSLYDFENREGIFPGVHRSYKFSLFTLRGQKDETLSRFAFFLTRTEQLRDENRVFDLLPEDFALLNPNTLTCPVFRTREDAELTQKIYRRVPVLIDERKDENPWGIRFMSMFHMSNDSHLFRTTEDLENGGYTLTRGRDLGRADGLCYVRSEEIWLPLYEAKMIWQFDHRFGTYENVPANTTSTHLPTPLEEQYANPHYFVLPRYWVKEEDVEARLEQWSRDGTELLWRWEQEWLLGFRNVTNATNERTAIFTIFPRAGVGNSAPIIFLDNVNQIQPLLLVANLGSLIFDYVARMKIAGTNMNFFLIKQLPVLPPDAYTEDDLFFIIPRALELVYTAYDLEPFALDVWKESSRELRREMARRWEECYGSTTKINPDNENIPPFRWNSERRAFIRAELDAYYARLYGLTRDELRYILDPKEVLGPDFPGETFRVLKEKEERLYGEYRTRRLVLEAWDRLERGER